MNELINRYFLEGYSAAELTVSTVMVSILTTALLAMYIFAVYKRLNKNSFYNRNFNLSLVSLAVITAAIILTIQSNIVVSLGMVGALSIIRFRTAIKDPLDLVFMFWSISVGIICGAGFVLIAVAASFVLTLIIMYFVSAPQMKGNMVLVLNADNYEIEDEMLSVVEKYCKVWKIKAKNLTKNSINMAIEVETQEQKEMLRELIQLSGVTTASVVENTGDVTV